MENYRLLKIFNGQAGGNVVNCAAEEKLSLVAGQSDCGS
jgi:hypothetical protein